MFAAESCAIAQIKRSLRWPGEGGRTKPQLESVVSSLCLRVPGARRFNWNCKSRPGLRARAREREREKKYERAREKEVCFDCRGGGEQAGVRLLIAPESAPVGAAVSLLISRPRFCEYSQPRDVETGARKRRRECNWSNLLLRKSRARMRSSRSGGSPVSRPAERK